MNERIRELENQAHELAWQEWKLLPESNDGTRMDAQALARFKNKFAELIVRECRLAVNRIDVESPEASIALTMADAAIRDCLGVK